MAYYVDLDAAEAADPLWAGWGAEGNIAGNTRADEARRRKEPDRRK
jgi:hypothetical protein